MSLTPLHSRLLSSERRAQLPTGASGQAVITNPAAGLGSLEWGGHVIKNPAMHRDLPTAWTCDAHQQKRVKHLRWHLNHQPPPHPSSPDPSLACPLKTHFLSGSPAWVALPFPCSLSHPSAHRSEPPRISPGPHAQFTDVGAEAQRGWLPWGLTSGQVGRGQESVTKQCLNLPPAHSTCHGASWAPFCDSHKLGKPCWRADSGPGSQQGMPPPDH